MCKDRKRTDMNILKKKQKSDIYERLEQKRWCAKQWSPTLYLHRLHTVIS